MLTSWKSETNSINIFCTVRLILGTQKIITSELDKNKNKQAFSTKHSTVVQARNLSESDGQGTSIIVVNISRESYDKIFAAAWHSFRRVRCSCWSAVINAFASVTHSERSTCQSDRRTAAAERYWKLVAAAEATEQIHQCRLCCPDIAPHRGT